MSARSGVAAWFSVVVLAAACSGGGDHDADGPGGDRGLIVSSGAALSLTDRDGEVVATVDGAGSTQPTWSRDGRRLVVVSNDDGGALAVEVRDGSDGELIRSSAAERSYFFFSWRPDGRRIAALGPGRLGTTLDILDGDGGLVTRDVIEGGSVFLAWEPGGADLLVHRDTDLVLLPEADDPVELGPIGGEFQTPAWLPGGREALVLVAEGSTQRLRRIAIDPTLDGEDVGEAFGPVGSSSWIVVDGAGGRAAIVHSEEAGGIATAAFGAPAATRPVQDTRIVTEVVDLATGARTRVTDAPALWVEWSPDGDRLLVATLAPTAGRATWSVWADGALDAVVDFAPSAVFFSGYMPFADQYVEQPRLWAPDGRAFTFGGSLDGDAEGAVVADLATEENRRTVDDAVVAFWSPADPGS